MKKLTAIIGAVVLMFALTSCGSSTSGSSGPTPSAVSNPDLLHPAKVYVNGKYIYCIYHGNGGVSCDWDHPESS